jgi:hypothetical protein
VLPSSSATSSSSVNTSILSGSFPNLPQSTWFCFGLLDWRLGFICTKILQSRLLAECSFAWIWKCWTRTSTTCRVVCSCRLIPPFSPQVIKRFNNLKLSITSITRVYNSFSNYPNRLYH